jgi:uncharacterized protein (TIGR03792 family)
MITEILYFQVSPEERQAWLAKDAAVWTAFLAQQVGYIRKESWLSDEMADELCLVIWWQSAAAMQAIPRAGLLTTEQAMGHFARAPIRVEIKQVVAIDSH